jgi:hypothetical protein
MDKICLIYQPAGIGDIFFCQAIAKHYVRLGYKVIYPIKSNLMYLKDYLAFEGITYVDESSQFPYKDRYSQFNTTILNGDFLYINLDQSHGVVGSEDGFMLSKYKLVNLDYKTWVNEFSFIRNKEREEKLFYDILGLKDGDKYILTNTKFGTPPNFVTLDIPIPTSEYKIVDMEFIEGTNLMDWCKALENASGIITVDTSIQYILEKLELNYDFFDCYPRDGGKGSHLNNIINIFNIPWEYKVLN